MYVSPIDCTEPTLFISNDTKETIQFICKILNIKKYGKNMLRNF